jgi:conjugal transfer pilus assembly protein TraU
MVHPVPTSQPHGCHPFGRSTAIWGAAHEYPVQGEDFGYLVWRKRNCCAF